MRQFFLVILTVAFSLTAFSDGTSTKKSDEFTNQSFELLAKNINGVEVISQTNQTLTPILDELGDYMEEVLFAGIMDSSDYKGPVKGFQHECRTVQRDSNTASCVLKIQYNDRNEIELQFDVSDDGNKPTEILNNRVSLSR